MRPVVESIELAGTLPRVDVLPEEYARLLGYPRGRVLEGRARELADWARDWYAVNGQPWFYARQVEDLALHDDSILIDGEPFHGSRLRTAIEQASAHSAIVVAVGAGPQAEAEARQCWQADKPDEYFFLEVFASAVVEHLTTWIGSRLCDWAEQRGMAVLPHSSPGYTGWDIAEQPRLLALLQRTRTQPFPSSVEAFDSGMLRPKKTQLAVFGLTHYTERLRSLRDLVPCENCAFGPCQYRRAPYRHAVQPAAAQSLVTQSPSIAVLARDAQYTVNRKALERWAMERLVIRPLPDGSLDIDFRYDGTTCSNMGRPLSFLYNVKLGPRAQGYPIREQHCAPAPGDTGHEAMCKYRDDPDFLLSSIAAEKPLNGQPLNAALTWCREPNPAGCYCDPVSRAHKWGLVLETIHYALVQREVSLGA